MKRQKIERKAIMIHVSIPMSQEIDSFCVEKECNYNDLFRAAVKEYINKYKGTNKKVKEV